MQKQTGIKEIMVATNSKEASKSRDIIMCTDQQQQGHQQQQDFITFRVYG